jgi:hypothetical protein
MAKERSQNPTCGDTVNLRLFTYNSNNQRDVQSIAEVNIYQLDGEARSTNNPEGLHLVGTFPGTDVVQDGTGQYRLPLYLDPNLYKIGQYHDVWTVTFEDGECAQAQIANTFKVHSNLWFTTPTPPIYDFRFDFRPNRIRKGSKRYVLVSVTPNVPRGSDILPYYENLAVVSDLRVSMALACGDCVPAEEDLRLVIDRQLVDYREQGYGYWFLDTTQLDEGIYNIWFEIGFGESLFVSEKNSLQIFS